MKLLYFDLETTGVRHWKDGIHQISGCIDINGKIMEWFDLKIRPNPKAEISDDALKVSGVTREEIQAYMPMEEGYAKLVEILGKYVDKFNKNDKMFLVGYNCASFDVPFLRALFVQNGDNYFGSWFYSASLDVMIIAAQYLVTERVEMENFKLGTVATWMGIEVDALKQHDARYDVEIMRELHRRVIVPFVKNKVAKNAPNKVKREPGKIVVTKNGLLGKVSSLSQTVQGKVVVFPMISKGGTQVVYTEDLSLPTILSSSSWANSGILCQAETLRVIGFID